MAIFMWPNTERTPDIKMSSPSQSWQDNPIYMENMQCMQQTVGRRHVIYSSLSRTSNEVQTANNMNNAKTKAKVKFIKVQFSLRKDIGLVSLHSSDA